MKLYYAKTSDRQCRHCGGSINRGQIYVVEQVEAKTTKWYFTVHYDCYIPWKQKKLQEKLEDFKIKHTVPTKRGRKPLPCLDRQKRDKLTSLRAYHEKAGNAQRVGEINRELEALKPVV